MMTKLATLLLVVLLSVVAQAFVPTAFVPRSMVASSTSTTSLGLFGGGKKKPAASGGPKKDQSVFGGKGNRITVREDEDAAMWIEGDDGSRQSAQGAGKKKGGK